MRNLIEIKEYAKSLHDLTLQFKQAAKDEQLIEPITSSNKNEKISTLGRAYETMLEHPLCKRFLRKKPRLYLVKEAFDNNRNPPVLMAISDKNILIPEAVFNALSSSELKAVVGHELGHPMRLDRHFRRHESSVEAEYLADQIGVVLAGEPQAFLTGSLKILDFLRQFFGEIKWAEIAKGIPNIEKRKEIIDQTVQRLSTPEGRIALEEEIAQSLGAEHRKLFPHHYFRSGGVMRP